MKTFVVTCNDGSHVPFIPLFKNVLFLSDPLLVPEESTIIFGGGTDVNPALYGEKRGEFTDFPDVVRDERESCFFETGKKRGCNFLGVCRGAQFLTVMNYPNPGVLFQHVGGHLRPHDIMVNVDPPKVIKSSSSHHQMVNYQIMRRRILHSVIAWSQPTQSRIYVNGEDEFVEAPDVEPEIFWMPKTQCLCFQGHPEEPYCTPNSPYTILAKSLVSQYLK